MKLSRSTLHSVPDLAGYGWGTLGTDKVVDARLEPGEGILRVTALGEAGAQECRVESEENPGPALEEDGTQKQTDPEEDLETRDYRHRSIVVLLDKGTESLSSRVLGVLRLGTRRRTGGRAQLLRWDNRWDQVCANVGGDVENRIDAVGEQSERPLGHKEPHKSHHYEVSRSNGTQYTSSGCLLRYWMFSSER